MNPVLGRLMKSKYLFHVALPLYQSLPFNRFRFNTSDLASSFQSISSVSLLEFAKILPYQAVQIILKYTHLKSGVSKFLEYVKMFILYKHTSQERCPSASYIKKYYQRQQLILTLNLEYLILKN